MVSEHDKKLLIAKWNFSDRFYVRSNEKNFERFFDRFLTDFFEIFFRDFMTDFLTVLRVIRFSNTSK